MGKSAIIAGNTKDLGFLIEGLEDTIVISLSDQPTYPFHYRFSPGEVGKILEVLERENVKRVTFFGKIEKKGLLKNLFKLDSTAIKLISKLRSLSDDSILSLVVEELNRRGIEVVSQKDAFSRYLADKGSIVGKIGKKEREDILYGFRVAKVIGGLGIGQTIVVKDKSVIAVEAVEGTDETIRRAGVYADDFIVVKVKRPIQSDLMDVPVIGPETIRVTHYSGGKVVAVEAGEVIIIPGTVEVAKELKIAIYGVKGEEDFSG